MINQLTIVQYNNSKTVVVHNRQLLVFCKQIATWIHRQGVSSLKTLRNTVGPPVMSDKTVGGPINKHQNKSPNDRQNLAISLI